MLRAKGWRYGKRTRDRKRERKGNKQERCEGGGREPERDPPEGEDREVIQAGQDSAQLLGTFGLQGAPPGTEYCYEYK